MSQYINITVLQCYYVTMLYDHNITMSHSDTGTGPSIPLYSVCLLFFSLTSPDTVKPTRPKQQTDKSTHNQIQTETNKHKFTQTHTNQQTSGLTTVYSREESITIITQALGTHRRTEYLAFKSVEDKMK